VTFSALVHLRNNDRDNVDQERSDARPKRGDIFDVRTRTAQYGIRESLRRWLEDGRDADEFDARFCIVRVNSGSVPANEVRAKLVRQATRPAVLGDSEFDEETLSGEVTTHEYVWRLRLSEFTPEELAVIDSDGEITMTQNRFCEVSEHKVNRCWFDPSHEDGYGAVRPDADDPLSREEEDG
jgi:hypothetical protein